MNILPRKILLVYQIFGVFPATYVKNKSGNITLQFSSTTYFWNLIVLLVQTFTTNYTLYHISESGFADLGKRAENVFDIMGLYLEAMCQNMFVILLFIQTLRNWRLLRDIYCSLAQCEEMLQQSLLGDSVPWAVAGILLYTQTLILVTLAYVEDNVNTLAHFLYLSQYMNLVCSIVQFFHISHSISISFEKINEELNNETNRLKEQILLRDLSGYFKKMEIIKVCSQTSLSIEDLLGMYWRLCDVVHLCNKYYGKHHLGLTFLLFLHIVATIYHLFSLSWSVIDPNMYMYNTNMLMWLVNYIILLNFFSFSGSTVTNKAAETGPLVCKLINRIDNTDRREQLISFLLQLPFSNTELSALGLFKVYNHILTSIAASVTTYLVILIQFRVSSETVH